VLRDDVPDAKSSASTNAVFRPSKKSGSVWLHLSKKRRDLAIVPRVQASRAHPAPVAPPPIIKTS